MVPDWEAELQRARVENYKAFRLSDAARKIKSFVDMTGLSEDQIKAKIRRDPIFRWFFVKDPKKQNFYENLAAKHIREMDAVRDFVDLHNSDKSICAGLVMTRKELTQRGGNPAAKTIDFQWQTGKYTVYATHKYTKESGGAQDNQYSDLHLFIKEANESHSSDDAFVAIADGPYYNLPNTIRGATKIESLRQASNKRNVFACTMDDLSKLLARLQL